MGELVLTFGERVEVLMQGDRPELAT